MGASAGAAPLGSTGAVALASKPRSSRSASSRRERRRTAFRTDPRLERLLELEAAEPARFDHVSASERMRCHAYRLAKEAAEAGDE